MENFTSLNQLTPGNCSILLINYQTKLAFTINSRDLQPLIDNALCLARLARTFEIPTILTTICADSFGGPLLTPLQKAFPDQDPIDCNKLSIWESRSVIRTVNKMGRRKLVMSGLWTNFSVAVSAIQALQAGYEVYVVTDACAELSSTDNDMAVQRMIEAGAVSLACSQIVLHFQTIQPPHAHYGRGFESRIQGTHYS